jgi:hypothetical protein
MTCDKEFPAFPRETLCRNGGGRQRASFGSFRIAAFSRLWVTVFMVEIDVSMVNKIMNLFAKRFRSKAPSAATLSPGGFVNFCRIGFDSLPSPNCDTVSDGGGGRFQIQGRKNL